MPRNALHKFVPILVLTVLLLVPNTSALECVCDYQDDDGDGQIDEDFLYMGTPVGGSCNGIGECGIGVVYCLDP
jgi:hypothetical protein